MKTTRGWFLLEMVIALALLGILLPGILMFYLKLHQHCLLRYTMLIKQTELGFMEDYVRAELRDIKQVQIGVGTLKGVLTDGSAVTYTYQNGKFRIKNGNANYFDLNTQLKVSGFESHMVSAHSVQLNLTTERGPVQWTCFLPNE